MIPRKIPPRRRHSIRRTKNVCSILSSAETTSRTNFGATHLWEKLVPSILASSLDAPHMVQELRNAQTASKFKEILEETLSPSHFRRAVLNMPAVSHRVVQRVMDIIEKRVEDPEKNPPLRVAVFGGSVTIGESCHGKGKSNKDCAWPRRFEHLVNHFFGRDIIQVYNLGIGGTGTSQAISFVKYWMYGNKDLETFGPDVVVNSYSTNDSLIPWGHKWPEEDVITVSRNWIHTQNQEFIRAVLEMNGPCSVPPLMVNVDDYVGPQHPQVMGEMGYVNAITQLASYYDTVAISYGETVRDIFYRDRQDLTFGNPKDVHYGPFAHQTVAWAVAFGCLELLINYCDDEFHAATTAKEGGGDLSKEVISKESMFLPPPLTTKLMMKNITAEYDAAIESSHRSQIESGCSAANGDGSSASGSVDKNPCVVSWVSTPGKFSTRDITNFFSTYQTSIDSWGVENQNKEGRSNKIGWVAKKEKASFSIQFPKVTKKLKTVSIFFMRSWGEKWAGSKAKFTISKPNATGQDTSSVLAVQQIAGVWDDEEYHVSLTLSETITLSEAVDVGETLDMKVDLVSGTTFKIMGMMICNR
mmetsp:Transcript_6328/g.13084  ORF Transcript_6328/g.13084 Transcript_6328/m.13084 type:complete len:585 (-) Transcript_6328:223-1977(-)